MKIFIIGSGGIASTVTKELMKSKKHQIIGVYSRNIEHAESFVKKHEGKAYSNLDQGIQETNPDCLYLATPHSAHYPVAMDCLKYHLPVIMEKSFTVNTSQTEQLTQAYQKENVFLMEAMWTRFSPVTRKVMEWIREGRIGNIQSFSAAFGIPFGLPFFPMNPRLYQRELAGGALLDLGIYPISYAEMLFGKPKGISCKTILHPEHKVDYEDDITLSYEGFDCHLGCSFRHDMKQIAIIKGDKGEIRIPLFYRPRKATLILKEGKETFRYPPQYGKGYLYEFDAVSDDIKAGKTEDILMSHSDTIEVMKILDTCRKQGKVIYPDSIESTDIFH